MKDNKKKFTLIELLVVIAIIGILVALVIPSLMGSYDTAKKTACQSNLSQIGQFITLYAKDNNNTFPYAFHGKAETWDDDLSAYDGRKLSATAATKNGLIKDDHKSMAGLAEIYRCPADEIDRNEYYARSYGINSDFQAITPWSTSDINDGIPTKVSSIQNPGEFIVIGPLPSDNNRLGGKEHDLRIIDQKDCYTYLESETDLTGLHGDYTFNFLMGDFSVKEITLDGSKTEHYWTKSPND
jgi:prepilin-type N-terminal cleavage/methylation domain-containing protein